MPILVADSFAFSEPKIPFIEFYIGPGKKYHEMPLNWLRRESPYFQHRLKFPACKMFFRAEEPMTFEHLRRWIQNRKEYLDFLEQDTLSKRDDETLLGDRCHLFLNLYCLRGKLQALCNEDQLIAKIINLLRYGHRLPLQARTIRTVFEKLPKESTMLNFLLKQVADDLVAANGHDYDYYAEVLEGPNAVPGLLRALFTRLREPRFRVPSIQTLGYIRPSETDDRGRDLSE